MNGLSVLREIIRGLVTLTTLGTSTLLAINRIINPDAVIALYGAILGMYGGAVVSAATNAIKKDAGPE